MGALWREKHVNLAALQLLTTEVAGEAVVQVSKFEKEEINYWGRGEGI